MATMSFYSVRRLFSVIPQGVQHQNHHIRDLDDIQEDLNVVRERLNDLEELLRNDEENRN